MKVIFTYRPYSLFSWLIRIFTFSKFSHVAVMLTDNCIIDATFKDGVKLSSAEEFVKHYPVSRQTIVDISVPDTISAFNFAIEQVGKPYDWTAILGIAAQRDWAEDDSWFCSELSEAIIMAGGLERFRESVKRITPYMSWSLK